MTSSVFEGFIRASIENGLAWRFSNESSIGAGLTKIFGFITGNYTASLTSRDLSSTGENTLVLLFEDTPYTGGSLITMQNRNRYYQSRSDLNPLLEIREGVTATPAGLPVTGARLLFSNKGVAQIGSSEESSLIMLKRNTSHIITAQNLDAQSATFGIGALMIRDSFIA